MIKQTFGSLAAGTLAFVTFAGTIGSIAIYGANLKNDFETAKARVIQLETQVSGLREQLDTASRQAVKPAAGPPGPPGPAGQKGDGVDPGRIERIEAELARLAARIDATAATEEAAMAPSAGNSDALTLTSAGLTGTARDGTGASWPFSIRAVVFKTPTDFSAEIEWPTLDSVNRIDGRSDRDSLRFVESSSIQRGRAALGCEYELAPAAGGQLSGTFRNCNGSPTLVGQVTAQRR